MSTQRWYFVAGFTLATIIMGISWKITDHVQGQRTTERERIVACTEVFHKFVGLSDQILPGLGVAEKDLSQTLRLAVSVKGISGQNALDAMLIEATTRPLSDEDRVTLMKWIALGTRQAILAQRPTSVFTARRDVFERARRHREFATWLNREWNSYINMCDGGVAREATVDAIFALEGASTETLRTIASKSDNENLAEEYSAAVANERSKAADVRTRAAPFLLDISVVNHAQR